MTTTDALLNIAENVVTDYGADACDDLETCACSMAALHREVRRLRTTDALAVIEGITAHFLPDERTAR